MLATSKSLRFSLKLLQLATKAATLALLVSGAIDSRPIAAQTLQAAVSSPDAAGTAPPSAIASERSETALIQRLAGRAVKQANGIGRTTVQSLAAPSRASASALAMNVPAANPAQPAASPAPITDRPAVLAANPHTPPELALVATDRPQIAETVKIQPVRASARPMVADRSGVIVPPTPMPPARRMVALQPPATVPVDRVFQSPIVSPPANYANPYPAAPTNPAYLAPNPYGMVAYPAPGYPMPMAQAQPTGYGMMPANYGGYGYPMPAAYPAAAMPALPSPYAALQLQGSPYGGGGMQLTPPVNRLQANASPLMAPSYLAPLAAAPQYQQPQYQQPPQYQQQYQQPPQYAQQYQPQPQYAPQPYYYAQPQPQQYVPPQYYAQQPQYMQPQYAPQPQYMMQPQYAPQPPQYYAPQPVPQYMPQQQPQQFAPQQPLPQQPLPQLGFYPQGGYQQPAIVNPLNAPLAVPVTGTGGASPSTEATALKGTPQSPLIRSTATNAPSLTLQGVYLNQAGDSSARARITGVYPLSSRALFGTSIDLSTGKGFSDTPNTGVNINELFFATSLAEIPNLRFAVGQLDLTSYFDRNSFAKDGATHFFNSTFQTNPALSAAGIGSRPGLLVNWSLSDNLEAKAAAFSSARGLSDFALNGFAGELGLRYGNAILRGTYVTGREANNGNVFDGAGTIPRGGGRFGILPDDRESAFGVNGEVFIPKLKMGLFARYGRYNNLDADQGADTYGAGLTFLDVFSADDRLGLAYGSALSNETLRRSVGLPKRDTLELFYDFRFLPNLRLGVSLQQRNDFSEIVAGVRVKTEFDITPKGRLLQ
jgi:hypothetical protein